VKTPPFGAFGVARSSRGASHRRQGTLCDDVSLLLGQGRGYLAAIGDGAGSAPLAREGATAAVSAAVRWLEKNQPSLADQQWKSHLARAVAAARKGVERRAAQLGAPSSDLATTLLIVAAWPHGLLAAHVGDGALVVCGHDTQPTPYFTASKAPRDGPANVTQFLTDSDFHHHTRYTRLHGAISGFVAFTDGLENLALDRSGDPFVPFVGPLLRGLRQSGGKHAARRLLADFLQSDTLQARTDDDTTLAIGLFQEDSK
jgi:hypothetical protein